MSFANDQSASELCLLSGLADKKPGTKVRFLGCVDSYDGATGVLTLGQPMTGTPTNVKAQVSLDAIIDRITAEHVGTSAWVNVMGRIEIGQERRDSTQDDAQGVVNVRVQGLLVWTTGPLDFPAYEKAVTGLIKGGSPAA